MFPYILKRGKSTFFEQLSELIVTRWCDKRELKKMYAPPTDLCFICSDMVTPSSCHNVPHSWLGMLLPKPATPNRLKVALLQEVPRYFSQL